MLHRRVNDPQVRRRQILAAARAALKKKPYYDLVMEDVARAAGISKGLLYLYFKDREQLFAFAVEDMLQTVEGRLDALDPTLKPLKALEAMVAELLEFGEEHKEVVSQFVGEQIMGSPHASRILEAWKSLIGRIGQRLEACIRSGDLRRHDTSLSADLIVEMVTIFITRKYILGVIKKPLRSCAGEMLEVVLYGFARRRRRG